MPPRLIPRLAATTQDGGWLLQDLAGVKPRQTASTSASPALGATKTPPLHPNKHTGVASMPPTFALGPPAATTPPSTPARRIPVYSSFDKRQQKASKKSTVVVHSNEVRSHFQGFGGVKHFCPPNMYSFGKQDLNPLRPCGACNEWLKKIAETNPYFQILTFTDADCNGVYCTSCDE